MWTLVLDTGQAVSSAALEARKIRGQLETGQQVGWREVAEKTTGEHFKSRNPRFGRIIIFSVFAFSLQFPFCVW